MKDFTLHFENILFLLILLLLSYILFHPDILLYWSAISGFGYYVLVIMFGLIINFSCISVKDNLTDTLPVR